MFRELRWRLTGLYVVLLLGALLLFSAGTYLAARAALMDPKTSDEVRTAARLFLTEWVTQPIVVIDPGLPAFAERTAIMHSLADVPVPEIANLARRDKTPR